MKTQLSRPARRKASYTDQYKQEALKLWRNSGRSAGAERGAAIHGECGEVLGHGRSCHVGDDTR
jgi:hypothetical protein